MQNSPEVERIQVMMWTAFATIGVAVWNLWLRVDPLFFLNFIDPDRVAPAPLPAVPWLAVGVVVAIAIFLLWRISANARAAERRARSLYPNVYDKLDRESAAGEQDD